MCHAVTPLSWNLSHVALPEEHRSKDSKPFLIAEKLGHAIGGIVDAGNMEHPDHTSSDSFSSEVIS